MFNTVIVGITGDHGNDEVVAAARVIARGAPLHLVHVYPDGPEPLSSDDDARWALRNAALGILEAAAATGEGETYTHAVPGYSASQGLKQMASELGTDLIVLGTSTYGPLGRMFLGDVSRAVLHGAPCPVLSVARGGAQIAPPKRIGVAYDGSPESKLALDLAVALAQDHDGTLEVVAVVDVGIIPSVWSFEVDEFLDRIQEPEAAKMAEICAALPVPAEGRAIRGSVAAVLAELSSRVDLMVCGSRSWGAARRVAMGSTADRLVHESQSPVIVVPRAATDKHSSVDPVAPTECGAIR